MADDTSLRPSVFTLPMAERVALVIELVDGLEAPTGDATGREAVARLGIDVKTWAEDIRNRVAKAVADERARLVGTNDQPEASALDTGASHVAIDDVATMIEHLLERVDLVDAKLWREWLARPEVVAARRSAADLKRGPLSGGGSTTP